MSLVSLSLLLGYVFCGPVYITRVDNQDIKPEERSDPGSLLKKFQPLFQIDPTICLPYPAVSESGQVPKGLPAGKWLHEGCSDATKLQTYGRATVFHGRTVLTYGYYLGRYQPHPELKYRGLDFGTANVWTYVSLWLRRTHFYWEVEAYVNDFEKLSHSSVTLKAFTQRPQLSFNNHIAPLEPEQPGQPGKLLVAPKLDADAKHNSVYLDSPLVDTERMGPIAKEAMCGYNYPGWSDEESHYCALVTDQLHDRLTSYLYYSYFRAFGQPPTSSAETS